MTMRRSVRIAVAAASVATFGLVAPQASAAEDPTASAVKLSAGASDETRALAEANPEAVKRAANVCGAGYDLERGIPLPVGTDPRMRLATLFSYTKGGNDSGCVILDNNLGVARKMSIKVCASLPPGAHCQTDSGKFSQYAGPVYTDEPVCAPVTATMADAAGTSLVINYKTEYAFLCD
ncbi:hypothetical protein [Streptomyces sp. NBC_00829]|uniref:hypothetical protein n=1 Tax=Streptomyces sp. NBC_00829 TaxID=2903679 RepID=UPI003866F8D1|nr:hypothetical protein OG293_35275 [Streptomyces sp. NBC_00829]